MMVIKWRKENTKSRNKPRCNICSFIYFVFYIPSSLFRKINGVPTNFPEYLNVCSGFRKCTWSRRIFIFYSFLFAGVLGDQRLIYWPLCLVCFIFSVVSSCPISINNIPCLRRLTLTVSCEIHNIINVLLCNNIYNYVCLYNIWQSL
jgi:hypothetical protein